MALRLLLLAALLMAGHAAGADGRSAAQVAFDSGNRAGAAAMWREAAERGDAEAAFKLAQMHDVGLGLPRDLGAAMRWYRAAAERGHAPAAFNLGLILDGGGRREAAAAWYGHAAAAGHARAQYNLGLLHAAGDGVLANPDLARAWFEKAGLTPAAPPSSVVAPAEAGPPMALGELRAGGTASLVWSAPPAPDGRVFAVEWVILDGPEAGTRGTAETTLSAVLIELPEAGRAAWRVGRAGSEATGAWRRLPDGAAPPALAAPSAPPVEIRVARGDDAALGLARDLIAALAPRGLSVRLVRASAPIERTTVVAGPGARGLAEDIAAFLPILSARDVATQDVAGAVVSIGGRAHAPEPPALLVERTSR